MLTKTRRSRATELEREISEELTQLAMPAARITVAIDGVGDGLAVSDEKRTRICSNTGSDSVTFLLTPHAGATPLPINKGASGGELSRIMLAIEVVLAGRSSVPTYVFDEVDAGVGGKAAVEVGRRLALLARHAQVLVVTHLPQVAVWADTHYSIRKNSSETVTTSDLALLSEGERTNELARMMAGREESALAQEHAQELLDFVAAERKRLEIARGKRA
jgi:DNA repair protein RecN (Recombination protein N)